MEFFDVPRGLVSLDIFANSLPQNLILVGNLLWVVTYILIVRDASKARTIGIPSAAVCLNFTWDFVYSLVYMPKLPNGDLNIVQLIIKLFWLALDVILLYQLYRYAKATIRNPLQRAYFFRLIGALLGLTLLGEIIYGYYADDNTGTVSGILVTLLMSILFIFFYFDRQSLHGISTGAAWTRLIGTALFGIAVLMVAIALNAWREYSLPLFLFGWIVACDIFFVFLILTHALRIKKPPAHMTTDDAGAATAPA